MNQSEALRGWLWVAFQHGQRMVELMREVEKGMPIEEAAKELEKGPLYQKSPGCI